ncbi:MAG: hypothetical protein V4515_04525 [Chloroflexota bacterium]
MTFPAAPQTRLRAGALRAALGTFGYTRTDQSFQTELYSDVAGLAFEVERNARYAFNGYVAYESGATPDIKFTLAGPEGATGQWGFYTLNQLETGSIGSLEALRLDLINDDSQQQGAAGSASFSSALMCLPRGFIQTAGVGGAVQVRFAQVTTNASATTVKEGSWLHAWQIEKFSV